MKKLSPLGFLRTPVFLGMVFTGIFYGILHSGIISWEFGMRYFAGVQIEYVETGFFFIGFSALLLKIQDVISQRRWLTRYAHAGVSLFGSAASRTCTPADALRAQESLRTFPVSQRESYFALRLEGGLDYVVRNNTASGLEDEMKYLSDMDANRMTLSYALIRVVIWAIPILGFLGTVMGITLAIGALGGSLEETASTLPQMIAGLSVAFDTTALALGLSIILMFTQYFVEKAENALLNEVDHRVHVELSGRFESLPNTPDGVLIAVKKMGEAVLNSIEKMTLKQSEIWSESFHQVEYQWTQRITQLSDKMRRMLDDRTDSLTVNVQKISEVQRSMVAHLSALQDAVKLDLEALGQTSVQLVHSADAISQATLVTQQLTGLQRVLADNLSVLKGAKNFEQTVATLSAAASALTVWLQEIKVMRKAA